jgi:glycosidase
MNEAAAGKEWIQTTNIYEVNLRQFSQEGTIRAFLPALHRLKEMAVEVLWFMPITPIAQKNKKGSMGSYYACSDYTAVNPEFGTLEDWKTLVRKAQDMGFKVILDWVANHTGWDHRWTTEHPDWYEKDPETGNFKKASGMDDIIELDYRNSQMRTAMTDAMKFWVKETGIDGFRCDLASWVEVDYWLEAIPEVNKLKPLFWLAEMDPLDHPEYMQVFDAAYTWTWMHRTRDYYHQQLPLHELTGIIDRYQHVPGIKAWFTTNHDENTWNGTEYEKYGELAKALAVFSCTWQGIPLVYNGQELPNHKRLEFFEKDPIEWEGEFELVDFYKTLFKARKNHPALHVAAMAQRLTTTADDRILAFIRKSSDRAVIVLLNLSRDTTRFHVKDDKAKGSMRNLFSGHYFDFDNQDISFEIAAGEFLVYLDR